MTIRASDRDASVRFYELVLRTLGIEQTGADDDYTEFDDFSVAQAADDKPVTEGLHIGFAARSRRLVDDFWRVGTEAGYRDDGEPGPRPEYRYDYYGAFLLDPDGNSAEAVHHGSLRQGGGIDHLWIRVVDVVAARRFYERMSARAGFRLKSYMADRAQFAGDSGSFSVICDPPAPPTRNLHMAFGVADNGTVDAFHREMTEAGHADNGAPGERAVYHPGYYGAFVSDPDGNNVELVNHNRG